MLPRCPNPSEHSSSVIFLVFLGCTPTPSCAVPVPLFCLSLYSRSIPFVALTSSDPGKSRIYMLKQIYSHGICSQSSRQRQRYRMLAVGMGPGSRTVRGKCESKRRKTQQGAPRKEVLVSEESINEFQGAGPPFSLASEQGNRWHAVLPTASHRMLQTINSTRHTHDIYRINSVLPSRCPIDSDVRSIHSSGVLCLQHCLEPAEQLVFDARTCIPFTRCARWGRWSPRRRQCQVIVPSVLQPLYKPTHFPLH